jgi:hypothetical protein
MKQVIQKLLHQKNKINSKININSNDTFLVSYPKSGNTWLRFLLANLLKSNNELINFHNVHNYCPEWERHSETIKSLSSPRIIKSHQQYNPKIKKIVYLIRDGRDVYVSYYNYLRSEGHIYQQMSFTEFLETYHFPYGYWSDHVNSWLNSTISQTKDRFHIVYYEDMLDNPLSILSKLANFIGLSTDTKNLKQAIENSSFEKMQNIEQKFGRKYSNENSGNFVRKGTPGEWFEYFGDKEYQILENRNELKMLENLGYDV